MTERGSVSILMASGALLLSVFALGVADLGAMLLTRARAQAAADAAALAAVMRQAPALGQDGAPADAARDTAEANGAKLEGCECEIGQASATVEVTMHPRIAFVIPWRDRIVHARSRAELNPDVLTYRESG